MCNSPNQDKFKAELDKILPPNIINSFQNLIKPKFFLLSHQKIYKKTTPIILVRYLVFCSSLFLGFRRGEGVSRSPSSVIFSPSTFSLLSLFLHSSFCLFSSLLSLAARDMSIISLSLKTRPCINSRPLKTRRFVLLSESYSTCDSC